MVSDSVSKKFGIEKVSDSVLEKFGIEKSIGFGIGKKLVSKKISDSVSERIWYRKVSESVLKIFGIGKKIQIRFRSDFGYRHTLVDFTNTIANRDIVALMVKGFGEIYWQGFVKNSCLLKLQNYARFKIGCQGRTWPRKSFPCIL